MTKASHSKVVSRTLPEDDGHKARSVERDVWGLWVWLVVLGACDVILLFGRTLVVFGFFKLRFDKIMMW